VVLLWEACDIKYLMRKNATPKGSVQIIQFRNHLVPRHNKYRTNGRRVMNQKNEARTNVVAESVDSSLMPLMNDAMYPGNTAKYSAARIASATVSSMGRFIVLRTPNGEVERRGVASMQNKAAYLDHRSPPLLTEDAIRDRSNRWLGQTMTDA